MYRVLNWFVILLLDSSTGNFRKPGGSLLLHLCLCGEHQEGSVGRGGGGGGEALCGSFCLLGDCRHLTVLFSPLISQLVK